MNLVEELRKIIPDPRRVANNPGVLDQHARDLTYHTPVSPDVVVYPIDTGEVSDILKFASAHRIPVTPYAIGSSLEGHVIPVQGGITLNMTQMNQIVEVRPDDMLARVEPGVTRRQLNDHLRQYGLFFPVDPGADASIGGMVATNASGTNAVRYGAMRQQVLGLEVVAADGTVYRTGSTTFKSSSGYNVTGLMVGSEGTLGIFTEITLRLYPIPEYVVAGRVVFPTLDNAAAAAIGMVRAGLLVAKVELVDAATIAAVNAYKKTQYEEKPTLFLELSGNKSGVEHDIQVAREICDIEECISFQVEEDEQAREELWSARHQVAMALLAANPGSRFISTDVCVPMSLLPDAIAAARKILDSHGLQGALFGHVGDGNFHAGLTADPNDNEAVQKVRRANAEIVQWALDHGGTATGEHGVGIGKRSYVLQEHGIAVDIMRRIKETLDPYGILNPGKVLPDPTS